MLYGARARGVEWVLLDEGRLLSQHRILVGALRRKVTSDPFVSRAEVRSERSGNDKARACRASWPRQRIAWTLFSTPPHPTTPASPGIWQLRVRGCAAPLQALTSGPAGNLGCEASGCSDSRSPCSPLTPPIEGHGELDPLGRRRPLITGAEASGRGGLGMEGAGPDFLRWRVMDKPLAAEWKSVM